MNIKIESVKILDQPVDCLFIKIHCDLTATFTTEIREAVIGCMLSDSSKIYLDARHSQDADLSGINEVMHASLTAKQLDKKMIFVFAQHSSVNKWVNVTGLDRFIETAIIPHVNVKS